MNKRKIMFLIVIMFTASLMVSCIGAMELNEYGIVTMVGHDKIDDEILLTMEIVNPVGKKEIMNPEKAIITQTKGSTIFEAIRNITLFFDRKLYFPHTKVFVFCDEVAKDGISKYLDFWQRDYEIRLNSYVLVCIEGNASELFGTPPASEDLLGDYVEYLINNTKYSGKSLKVNLRELAKQYYSEGSNVYVTGVIKKEAKTSTPGFRLNVEGMAVFIKDKLAGYLDGEETKGYNIIKNNIKSALIVVPSGYDLRFYTIKTLNSKAKSSVKLKEEKCEINIDVKMETLMNEIMTDERLRDVKVIDKIEKATEEVVKSNLESLIERAQNEFKADIFHFNEYVYRNDYENWNKVKSNWDEVFCNASVKVNVDVDVNRDALLEESFLKEEVE